VAEDLQIEDLRIEVQTEKQAAREYEKVSQH